MFEWLRGRKPTRTREVANLRKALAKQQMAIQALYDAAHESNDTRKLFPDYQIEDTADKAERERVRKIARYEAANNAYIAGMVKTRQNDIIGTGPKLQIISEDREAANEVETKFRQWLRDTHSADKLRLLIAEYDVSGEGFGYLRTNGNSVNPVTLDWSVLEPEQIADESEGDTQEEGITYDEFGNPTSFAVLPKHPGGEDISQPDEAIPVEARWIIHLFDKQRAGQLRGVSGFVASLIPAALLRNYTLAVVKAANIAASISFLIHTEEVGEDATACTPYDLVDLEHGSGMALPDGYKGTQLKAEQPTDTYADFKNEVLSEVGRPLVMPRLKASGDASPYNYSSGRLDGQEYYHGIDVIQAKVEIVVCDKLFTEWWNEAVTVGNYLTPAAQNLVDEENFILVPEHRWGWDGRPHVDPAKERQADAIALSHGMAGLHELYALRGKDCDVEMEKAAACFGVTVQEYQAAVLANVFGQPMPGEENNDGQSQEEDESSQAE